MILIIYMVKLDRIHVVAVLQPASLAVYCRLLCCPGAVAQLRPVRPFCPPFRQHMSFSGGGVDRGNDFMIILVSDALGYKKHCDSYSATTIVF